jgi:beta-ureidopropionase / N-carbamoyl-L-amino-acid hydrolase
MLQINQQRLLDDLKTLSTIGATPEGGVSRLAMSEADVEGRNWFRQQAAAEGFECRQDGAGNLSAVLPSKNPNAKTLLLGSHLDSVPNGGNFDGPLGVLAALEILRTVRDAGLDLPVHLEAISFTDEEGSILGLFGSKAAAGLLTHEQLQQTRSGAAVLEQGMARLGITLDSVLDAKRNPDDLIAYLELHIEQGARLEKSGHHIGVVTSIVGVRAFWLNFTGFASHAGTTPMLERKDALWGAAEFVQRGKLLVIDHFLPGVMNCGIIQAHPAAFNIIPDKVELALEFRHGTEEELDTMQTELFALAHQIAAHYDLGLIIESAGKYAAAPMADHIIQTIEDTAQRLGLTHTRLMSFAGHDPQSMSKVIPAGMLFVPSVNGVSHNPKEFTHPHDVVNGANVLLNVALALAGGNSHV